MPDRPVFASNVLTKCQLHISAVFPTSLGNASVIISSISCRTVLFSLLFLRFLFFVCPLECQNRGKSWRQTKPLHHQLKLRLFNNVSLHGWIQDFDGGGAKGYVCTHVTSAKHKVPYMAGVRGPPKALWQIVRHRIHVATPYLGPFSFLFFFCPTTSRANSF